MRKNMKYILCLLVCAGLIFSKVSELMAINVNANRIDVNTSTFNTNLDSSDSTVQAALETLDDVAGGGGGAPTTADYLVGTANGSLSAEIVVGTTPGGSLGGTWGSPTIDDLFLKNDADDTTLFSLWVKDIAYSSAWNGKLHVPTVNAIHDMIGVNVQAYDADLTTYAGITPSANVQSILSAADYSAIRTLLSLVIGTNVQAYDADLTTYAGITPSANVQSVLSAANYAAIRALLDLEAGTDFYSMSAADSAFINDDVDDTSTANIYSRDVAYSSGGWNGKTFLVTANAVHDMIGSAIQAYDADLTTYAGITPSANVQSLLGAADYSAMRTLLSLVVGTNVQAYDADLATLSAPTAWRSFYSNGSSAITELAFGASGTFLKSNGASSAPTWDTPGGSGDMLKSVYDKDADDISDTAEELAPSKDYGDVSTDSSGTIAVDNNAVSFSDLADTVLASADWAKLVSDETGSGLLVFGTSPTLTTPTIAGSTGTGVHDFGGATSFEVPNGTDKDVTDTGQISCDIDGANETADRYYRGIDVLGNQFPVGQKLRTIQCNLIEPDQIDDGDTILVWHNTTGMTATIVEIKAWSDLDNTSLNLVEYTSDTSFSSPTTVDAVEIATNGTGVFYSFDTTITHATIEHDHTIGINYDSADAADYAFITIVYWLNANVD